jgi:diacylglycerol kinase (ATP)
VSDSVEPGRHNKVAVVAHRGKSFGGGLGELRTLLAAECGDVLWYEVSKSRKAPGKVAKALARGADLVFVWGGDGMVQRCADALVGSGATMAIVPAGTANLFARDLGIPPDLIEAVHIGLHGACRSLDLGWINGEHFAVMAGVGFDARMIDQAGGRLKKRLGRLAYVWTGIRSVNWSPTKTTVKIDGKPWFSGRATCVLLGNVGTILGSVEVFDDARSDDGWLDVGVCTAKGPIEWIRTLGRTLAGPADRSPFVQTARAKQISIKLGAPSLYELDGGARKTTARVKAHVVPGGLKVHVPSSV